jgi:chromosome segregation ATPase
MHRRSYAFASALALGLALTTPSFAEEAAPTAPSVQKLDSVIHEKVEADRSAQASQKRIDAIDDETQKMLADYRKAVSDADSYTAYAAQLGRQIESQEMELAEIDRQLAEVETTARSITPLQQKMLATLHQFVELDIPFLAAERTARVKTLEAMMDRADVSISEKYRRIVEAYQVEMDYGRTIEAYEAQLEGAAGTRTANFLRIGRVALLYQTLDGRETGFWDNQTRSWKIDNQYAHSFKEGVAVARKQSAPEMLIAPVPAPTPASMPASMETTS